MSTVDFRAPPLFLKIFPIRLCLLARSDFLFYPFSFSKKRISPPLFFRCCGVVVSRVYARLHYVFSLIFSFIYFTFLLFVYQMRSLLPLLRKKSEDKAINVTLIGINAEEITINAEEIIC